MTGVRALLVSPDDWLRTALEVVLTGERSPVTHVRAAASAQNALAEAASADVVLFDAEASDVPAPEWCSTVLTRSAVPVLVLHSLAEVDLLAACLEAGASGFQTKDLSVAELFAAIEAVCRGEAVVPPRMLGALLGSLIQRRRRDEDAEARYNTLTRREREILATIAAGDDGATIARQLFISPQTARTHIQNVLGKLGVHSRLEAANFAHQHGYADRPTERAG